MWFASSIGFFGFFQHGGVVSGCFGVFAQAIVVAYLIVAHTYLPLIDEGHTSPFDRCKEIETTVLVYALSFTLSSTFNNKRLET
jgi:hypothetical protein